LYEGHLYEIDSTFRDLGIRSELNYTGGKSAHATYASTRHNVKDYSRHMSY